MTAVLLSCAAAEDAGSSRAAAVPSWNALAGRINHTVKILTFGAVRDPRHPEVSLDQVFQAQGIDPSSLGLDLSASDLGAADPDISDLLAETDLRVDLTLRTEGWLFMVKPRLDLSWERWDDRAGDGEDEDWSEASYVNEWLVRYHMSPQLALSYGRENIQWGPSYMVSPSSPFTINNGRNSPKQEVPGSDFARVVWMPDHRWTLSFIANTDEGRREVSQNVDAEYDQALTEIDTWRGEQEALIQSTYEQGLRPYRPLREFGRPVTDSIYARVLAEANAQRAGAERLLEEEYARIVDGLDQWREDMTTEFARTYALKIDRIFDGAYLSAVMSKTESEDPRFGGYGSWVASDAMLLYCEGSASGGNAEILFGGSYTLLAGPTVMLEYFFNESGTEEDPIGDLVPPACPLDARNFLLRRNYLLLQVTDQDVLGDLDVTLRWQFGLDDDSSALLAVLEHELGNHAQLFSTVTVTTGDEDTEFGSLVSYEVVGGIEFTF